MCIRWLAWFGLSGVLAFVAAFAALHVVQPRLSPLDEAMSYYVHGAHGWLTTLALVAIGVGSLSITAAVSCTSHGRITIVGTAALAIWSLGAIAGGVFSADPPGNWDQPPSMAGAIHEGAAMVAIVAFPVAAFALSRSFRGNPGWPHWRVLLALAYISIAGVVAFAFSLLPVFVTDRPPILLGLTERIMLACYALWLAAVAAGLIQNRDEE